MLRYVPLTRVLLRAGPDITDDAVRLALAAARAVGVTTELSSPLPRPALHPVIESDGILAARLGDLSGLDKLRLLGSADDKLRLRAHDTGLWVDDTNVVAHPTLEALRWVREQALSETRHRHGNLTGRHPGPLDR